MLKANLNECVDCVNLLSLLCEIDEKLKYYAENELNNMTLMLNRSYDKYVMSDLLHYKQIVTHRLFNPHYASSFQFSSIISRIKILLNK